MQSERESGTRMAPTVAPGHEHHVDSLNEKRTRGVHAALKQGKNMVWTMVALQAEDQLRQRVAWALAQIFVISDTSMKWNEIETWHAYYG